MGNDFKKPEAALVKAPEYIEGLINAVLHKDLQEHEKICEHCHGTGMVICNNPYGLRGEGDNITYPMFPYKHQALTFCPHCYNGVVKVCKFCGKETGRQFECECEGYKKYKEEKRKEHEKEEFSKAFTLDEKPDEMLFMYSEDYSPNDGYFETWEEFFEDWFENHTLNEELPQYVWATEEVGLRADADWIVECATEELGDDVYAEIYGRDIKELQEYLDNWCKKVDVTRWYFTKKYKLRIPWEQELKEKYKEIFNE